MTESTKFRFTHAADRIGIPFAADDPNTDARICPACGQPCPERYDVDGERLTNNYGKHYMAQHLHDAGLCRPADHDRSLPDGPFRVMSWEGIVLHTGAADAATALKIAAGHQRAYVTKGEQQVAADGLIGCNDCGEPIFWCHNDEWYHHLDPARGCFLIRAES